MTVTTYGELVDELACIALLGLGGVIEVAGAIEAEAPLVLPSRTVLIGLPGHEILQSDPAAQVILLDGVERVTLRNLRIVGTGGTVTAGQAAIRLGLGSEGNGAHHCTLRDIEIVSPTDCGVTEGSKSSDNRLDGVRVVGAGEHGFYLNGLRTRARDCESVGAGSAGLKTRAVESSIDGFRALDSGQYGALITTPAGGGCLRDARISGAGLDGVRYSGDVKYHQLRGTTIDRVNLANQGRSAIRVQGGVVAGLVIEGNVCYVGEGGAGEYGLDLWPGAAAEIGWNVFGGTLGKILDRR